MSKCVIELFVVVVVVFRSLVGSGIIILSMIYSIGIRIGIGIAILLIRYQLRNMCVFPRGHLFDRLPHPELAIKYTFDFVFPSQIHVFVHARILETFFVVAFFAIINIDIFPDFAK